MDMILGKLFATALALSEVMTQPQAVKTQFDPVKDQDAVVQTLRDGCAHMRQAFDIESINIDDLINTALDDPSAVGTKINAFTFLHSLQLIPPIAGTTRLTLRRESIKPRMLA